MNCIGCTYPKNVYMCINGVVSFDNDADCHGNQLLHHSVVGNYCKNQLLVRE